MFWKRDKKIRVELLTPINITSPGCGSPPASKPVEAKAQGVDTDLALKLAVYFSIGLQALLIVYGYLELAAYYEQYGIGTSELDLGTPTLLLYGYAYAFAGIMSTVNIIPLVGPVIPGLVAMMIGVPFVYILMHRFTKMGDILQRGMTVGTLLLLVFILPALGVLHGIDRAKENINSDTGMDVSNGVSKEHSILTDKNEKLTGHLVVADTKSTFLLVKDTVYKIDNASNRVMRQTLLQPKPKKNSGKAP